ncbi:hypothetical protein KM1_046060 [Entamoeba histolytica HM-3:IMSS]|uniref:Uncharacterized protein n=6 Tax=Entamoeba histolytica TaxID=5759 RepID=B1N3Q1_ENTH1|nr:hypothetical protein EHI_139060 [Entamoeba histolytica HM-1:IMSS]EMD43105.1 Hypothetical protein EHI5A_036010 [Entamoeba histolytica KU27]EMS14869.1 hypothetical protein KM1_046060 [Entamoeba histolytica HM-3:IMSS]ENY64759.1 hypothetical protein EHI7A_020010 [Entamoeba histolytica HM-1:IMSS-A]GAT96301.1 hypothetical protein CL6EHI_139060 [Entamoeba histolytica]EDS89408.1 hypothetical protein EHI_139060 [Entamoeba histolytica HM-1:IMSS]|eukprot:XP_001913817.1 hypothetical protein EHI_139060 [Entamoeba histolytica HM-1:IMSS]
MKVCYLPKFLLIPSAILIIMGSLIYGMILGAVTGFYQMALAGVFVVVGIIGIISGLIRDRITSFCFMIGLCVVWVGGVAMNIMGIVKPTTLSTFDNEIVIGDMKIKPTYEWFLGGLVFILVVCTPCLCISICNCATIGNLIQYKKDKQKRKEKKKQNKMKMKPIVQAVPIRSSTLENELGNTSKRNTNTTTKQEEEKKDNFSEKSQSKSSADSSIEEFDGKLEAIN